VASRALTPGLGSPFLEAEFAGPAAAVDGSLDPLAAESPFVDGLLAEALEAIPADLDEGEGPGRRIRRAVVTDALVNQILDLLWERIASSDVARIKSRLARLGQLLDEVPDGPAACRLLRRLSGRGDLARDFD
jgi:hypothetical protein